MEQRPSWEACSRSASEGVTSLLRNPKNHLCPQEPATDLYPETLASIQSTAPDVTRRSGSHWNADIS